MLLLPFEEVDGAAAMGQPAHDYLVAIDHLLPVDAEVQPFLEGAFGDHHAPGDQPAGVVRPASLYRQRGQVHVAGFEDVFPAGYVPYLARIDVAQFPEGRRSDID